MPVEIGNKIRPKPVSDYATELEVVAKLTKISTVCERVDKTSYFQSLPFGLRYTSSK